MSKVILILAVFAALASVILTMPQFPEILKNEEGEDVVAIPTDALIHALEDQHHIKLGEGEGQNRGNLQNLFNLSATLSGAPNNSAAFTFIPLVTLLLGNLG